MNNTKSINEVKVISPKFDEIPRILRELGQWVLWRLGDMKTDGSGRYGKVPISPVTGMNANAHDSQNWLNFDQAVDLYTKGWIRGTAIAGIAIDLPNTPEPVAQNERGEPLYLIGIDIDECVTSVAGKLKPSAEAAEIRMRLGRPYCEISPSGTGVRMFVLHKKPLRGGNKGGREMYSSGRFLTVTGHGSGELAEAGEVLEEIECEWFGRGGVSNTGGKLGNSLSIAPANQDQHYEFVENREDFFNALCAAYPDPSGRDDWLKGVFALAYLVVAHNWPEVDASKIRESWEQRATDKDSIDSVNNEGQWQDALRRTADRIKAGEDVTTHRTILELARANGWKPEGEAEPGWLDEMNREYFVAPFASSVVIFRQEGDAWVPLKQDAFRLLLANKHIDIATATGSKKSPVSVAWMGHEFRRQYSGVGFWPGKDAPEGRFNFWTQWPIQPKSGDVTPALNHIHEVICDGDEKLYRWVLGWCAYCVQHPNEQGHTALVIKSGRGTGKTMFADWLKAMFGRHAMTIANGKLLTGDFTGHLEKLVVLVTEEAFWAGDKSAESTLKHLITGSTLTIHHKGFTPYEAPNYLHIIMTSNEDWVVPAGLDERRFCVCNVSEARKGDIPYFTGLAAWAESGGIAALLDYLLHYDLTGFNVRQPPDTAGLRDQKLMSLEPAARWILHRLEVGGLIGTTWNSEVLSAAMVSALCEHQQLTTHERRRAETQLGTALRRIFPEAYKVRIRTSGGVREQVYRLGARNIHEARRLFEAYSGLTGYDWGDDA